MFRPISMVVPDSNYIAEIILFGEGFSDTRLLATKVYTLYQLCAQQLSKQGLLKNEEICTSKKHNVYLI